MFYPAQKVTKVSMIRNVSEKYHLGCSVENAVEGKKLGRLDESSDTNPCKII